jgi:nucleotide-binding universal stress UspA family protein
MYKTILVLLDGSKVAEGILPHVENLAKRYGAKVIVVQIIEPIHFLSHEPAIDLVEETMIKDLHTKTQEYFHKLQWRLRTQGIYTETRIEVGNPVKKILELADKENADLIAMVNRGQTGLSRVFYGSVAVGVSNRTDRPLLIIRASEES